MSTDFKHPNAQPFVFEAGDAAVLFIHGFTGAPGHLRTVGEAVREAGFSARGILLPGHGATIRDMGMSNGGQWLDACCSAFMEMEKKYRRVAVAGLSMGGLLAMLLAERFQPSCMILFAPAYRYKRWTNHLSPLAKHFKREVKWNPPKDFEADFLSEYNFGYEGAPIAKVEDMTMLQRRAAEEIEKITCPTLILQSHRDESVHRTAPERIARGVSSAVKEIAWVDRSTHVCTIGPDRDYLNGRVIDFLKRFGV